ncbi:ATP-binding protein [Fusibacter bizertensis]|jgi:DNA replication protein|uniref:ATP-binding protein n=1 Tax=Fusibacter bizertensis TaxID=1488331 RepID=A0ABT6NDI9_9FIRM|nr:ATP-binding protein [Fusibacter bizertensis]MDH8678488.1 ATP-binding protein [Fusibacter bizertensis]
MNNTYHDILEAYRRVQDKNKADRKYRKQLLYDKIPRLAQIDLQMSQLSADISKHILKSPRNTEALLSNLKQQLDGLKSEKAVLLTDHNIPADYLDIQYNCKKCKDTGFTKDNMRCSCFTQKLISKAYEMSGIEQQLEKQNFDQFKLDVFSTQILPKEKLSQRENMMRILSEAESFVSTFPNGKNMLFFGSSGLGKTFMCNCIAKSLLDKGYSVIYQTPFSIINILEKKTFTDKNNPFIQMAYEQLFEVDLLIIDDLGTESANTFTISEFYNIINSRILKEKSTIISTNIKLSEIVSFYNDRIDSRLKGHYQMLKFYGPDIRWEH